MDPGTSAFQRYWKFDHPVQISKALKDGLVKIFDKNLRLTVHVIYEPKKFIEIVVDLIHKLKGVISDGLGKNPDSFKPSGIAKITIIGIGYSNDKTHSPIDQINVVLEDANRYLKSMNNPSIDGISSFIGVQLNDFKTVGERYKYDSDDVFRVITGFSFE